MESLENARREAEEEHKKAQSLRFKLDEAKKKADLHEAELEKSREKLMEKTRESADRIIENARNKSALLLNELEEMKKQLNADNAAKLAEKARAAYKSTINELEKSADPVTKKSVSGEAVTKLTKGDIVLIADINRDATVVDIKQSDKKALVMSGSMKMWVDFENLRLKNKSSASTEFKKTRRVTGLVSRGQRTVSGEVDLRGYGL